MRKSLLRSACLAFGLLTVSSAASAAVPSFPGAEGFGAVATGGRGGRVIKVTTLNRTGAGSLQDALNQAGPRIIVFTVSGVIQGDIDIPSGNVTIAGQTAPGAGITISGHLYAEYSAAVSNIIVRHVRVRPRPLTGTSGGDQYDAIQFSLNTRFILDHVTTSWASDETVDMYEAKDATLQYCTIEESSIRGHSEGAHNYGMINGPNGIRMSIHHNLFAHHLARTPAVATGPTEIRNNVIYDVRQGFVHHNPATGAFNIVGNYFKKGPSAQLFPLVFDDEEPATANPSYFVRDTYIDDAAFSGIITDPWTESSKYAGLSGIQNANRKVGTENNLPGLTYKVTTQPVQQAYQLVLDKAGAFPRDVTTLRTVDEVKNRTGSFGAKPPADLMQGLTAGAAPKDTDNDGIPDDWETAKGLNPNDAADNKKVMPSEYTAIEEYINEVADKLIGGAPPGQPPGTPTPDGGVAPGAPPGTTPPAVAPPGGTPPLGVGPDGQPLPADGSSESSGCSTSGASTGGSVAFLGLLGLVGLAVKRRRS